MWSAATSSVSTTPLTGGPSSFASPSTEMALARAVRSEVRAIEADWAVRFGEKHIAALRKTLALIVSEE